MIEANPYFKTKKGVGADCCPDCCSGGGNPITASLNYEGMKYGINGTKGFPKTDSSNQGSFKGKKLGGIR